MCGQIHLHIFLFGKYFIIVFLLSWTLRDVYVCAKVYVYINNVPKGSQNASSPLQSFHYPIQLIPQTSDSRKNLEKKNTGCR